MRARIAALMVTLFLGSARADVIATLEDVSVPPNSRLNDAGGGANGRFTSAGNAFNNAYSPSFGGIWSGWAISTVTDGTTPGFQNQYAAKPGAGAGGSRTYAVAFPLGAAADPFHPADSFIDLAAGASPLSIDVVTTAYSYFAMKNGDAFTKAFGPGSFFRLDVQGFAEAGGTGSLVGTVDFYLADFRGGASLIVSDWTSIDLSPLAGARSLRFGLRSSDNHPDFGMNTPAYFAADNLRLSSAAVPEPSAVALTALGLGIVLAYRRRMRA